VKTAWDYPTPADAYLDRPDDAESAIDEMPAARGLVVTAVEPNDAMRPNGRTCTEALGVTWVAGTAEATTPVSSGSRLVAFGSSFNVTAGDCVDARRSHATLERQAGASFHAVVDGVQTRFDTHGHDLITVPCVTPIPVARRR
jgi:hypothetical protein